ncbi:MAG TPA: hypothetical protein VE010_05450 [Thermoanaerobaculia bacterium]|nr:hypothetical protein [Thermoanaerobaculia bacterium]
MSVSYSTADLERLLLNICHEATELRRELASFAGDLRADEMRRIAGTLDSIEARSTALLLAMPGPVPVN